MAWPMRVPSALHPVGRLPVGAGGSGECAPRSAVRTANPREEAGTVPGREKKLTRERRCRMVDPEADAYGPGAIVRDG